MRGDSTYKFVSWCFTNFCHATNDRSRIISDLKLTLIMEEWGFQSPHVTLSHDILPYKISSLYDNLNATYKGLKLFDYFHGDSLIITCIPLSHMLYHTKFRQVTTDRTRSISVLKFSIITMGWRVSIYHI